MICFIGQVSLGNLEFSLLAPKGERCCRLGQKCTLEINELLVLM